MDTDYNNNDFVSTLSYHQVKKPFLMGMTCREPLTSSRTLTRRWCLVGRRRWVLGRHGTCQSGASICQRFVRAWSSVGISSIRTGRLLGETLSMLSRKHQRHHQEIPSSVSDLHRSVVAIAGGLLTHSVNSSLSQENSCSTCPKKAE